MFLFRIKSLFSKIFKKYLKNKIKLIILDWTKTVLDFITKKNKKHTRKWTHSVVFKPEVGVVTIKQMGDWNRKISEPGVGCTLLDS